MIQQFFTAMYHLYFFKPYTIYPRWLEISLGIMAWGNLGLLIWIILKQLLTLCQN
jgi:hypothetical protein